MTRPVAAPDEGMTDAHRALMLEVLKQFRVLLRSMDTHYRQVEKRSGLGGAQLWALSEIAAPGGITVGDLAAKLAIHLSTASNLISRLEQLGLVTRSRSRTDQRVVALTATPAGRRKLRRAPQPSAGRLQDTLLSMGPRELRALRTQLDRVLRRMGPLDARADAMPLGDLLGGARHRRPQKKGGG